MTTAGVVIVSLAYILGLLSQPFVWGGYTLLSLGIVAAIALPKGWRGGPKAGVWLAAGIVGFLASVYLSLRVPVPAPNDISHFVVTSDGSTSEQVVMVWGKVLTMPQITRSSKAQFWMEANQLSQVVSIVQDTSTQPAEIVGDRAALEQLPKSTPESMTQDKGVSGKLYVTVPLLQATGLHSGQIVNITGVLYKPKPPSNPGAFDFQAFLAREGSFAGLVGHQLSWQTDVDEGQWGWWAVRQKIVQAQVAGLGVPEGQLLSAMVLGRRAVDLPYELRDRFVEAGLAHVLAASGFHVSLILGLVLAITRRFSERIQFAAGLSVLVLYVGVTGASPSVLRAAVMGIGALVALAMRRTVKPLGTLLLAAIILLVFNPNWIWDIGFQMSFLATLGLVVTVPPLVKWLDWLPVTLASLLAIPIAASVWVLPLQIYTFGLVAPYSILVNAFTTPIIALITIGGFISAIVAFISPVTGSTLAGILYYPVQGLISIVEFSHQLPGNVVSIGKISLLQMLAGYAIIGLIWFYNDWKNKPEKLRSKFFKKLNFVYYILVFTLAIFAIIPIWQNKVLLFRVTVLATGGEPVLVIQDRGKVSLINCGDDETVQYTVLPFLQQQGVNQIDSAIATTSEFAKNNGWAQLLAHLPVKSFYTIAGGTTDGMTKTAVEAQNGTYHGLPVGQTVAIGATKLQLLNAEPSVVFFQIEDQTWLLLGSLNPSLQQRVVQTKRLPKVDVLWWSGEQLTSGVIAAVQPNVAIASSNSVEPNTVELLKQRQTQLYSTGRDGALQWTPNNENFEKTLEVTDKDALVL